jgi:hypothetical protein
MVAQAFRAGNKNPPKCALIRAPQVRVGKPSGIISAGNTFGCPYRTIFIFFIHPGLKAWAIDL